MTTTIKQMGIGALTLLFSALLTMPFFILAHDNHPPGAPAHPTDSLDFHQTDVAEAAVAVPATSEGTAEQHALLALLLELVALLQAELAAMTGGDAVVTDVVSSASSENDGTASDISDHATYLEGIGNATITTDDTYRYISSNGLPSYTITGGHFATEEQAIDHERRVPLQPELNSAPTYYSIPFEFGIAVNGVTFEPFAAEFYNDDRNSDWQEDPFVTLRGFDDSNAHVQPTGLYHYHGLPEQLFDGDTDEHSHVIGYAADGFPVYYLYSYEDAADDASGIMALESGWELKSGTRPDGPGGSYDGTYNEDYEFTGAGDLDECNGRYGVTPEYPDGTYYYVLTKDFPYVPRCLMGNMDPSFAAGPPGR